MASTPIQGGHAQPVHKIDLRVPKNDPESVHIEVKTVGQPDGTGDTYVYECPRLMFVQWMRDKIRQLDPSPVDQMNTKLDRTNEALARLEDLLKK